MNLKFFIGMVIVAVAAIGGWYFLAGPNAVNAPTGNGTPTSPQSTPPPAASGETHTIIMNAAGFVPSELVIKVGDTVVFRNEDTRDRWPASDIHPTHLLCPGFDSLKPMKPGEVYHHTFTKAETCPMHDHLIPRYKGSITIEQ